MLIVSADEMQDNFSHYLDLVAAGEEIVVTKDGVEVGRFVPKDAVVSYLTDSLIGVLKDSSGI